MASSYVKKVSLVQLAKDGDDGSTTRQEILDYAKFKVDPENPATLVGLILCLLGWSLIVCNR